MLRISPSEVKARVRAAANASPRLGLTGESLPPLFPAISAAQARGEISTAHARVVVDTVDGLPATIQAV